MQRHARRRSAIPLGPLKLEAEQGYLDKAVRGGMSAFIRHAAEQLREADLPDEKAQALNQLRAACEKYASLSPAERRPLIARAESLLKDIPPPKKPRTHEAEVSWDDPVTALTGVGPARAELLARLGITSIGDLLQHYPARYEDRRRLVRLAEIQHGQTVTLKVTVAGRGAVIRRGRRRVTRVPVTDGDATGELVWFNQPYRVEQFKGGDELVVVGAARVRSGQVSLTVAECETAGSEDELQAGRIVPVYPTIGGLSQRMLRRLVHQCLTRCRALPEDRLPEGLRERRELVGFEEALRETHFPSGQAAQRRARRRLAYEELFMLQLRLARRRHQVKRTDEGRTLADTDARADLEGCLPFELTGAQQRVMDEIAADLASPTPAQRLIHGEVGSGKTVVAALALLVAARCGSQAAVMAPTEVLAEQHFLTLGELLKPLGLSPVLLTASLSPAERREVHEALASGKAGCAVGTHALFSEGVRFADLGVVIIDEQHRFGVRQRGLLTAKGARPNVFVMSATPIPRTLALTAYGDFDISVLDELPPGRKAPETRLLAAEDRDEAYAFLKEEVGAGRQAYIVCPAIEQSVEEIAAARERFEALRAGELCGLRLALLHGRMDPGERRETMAAFREGNLDVLVSTSLIEVGVDVANASVMVIENAERFGLAQLHQLRGRISRSSHQPYCLMLASDVSPEALDRLRVLVRTHDGFEIAEEDLRRRGPGELAGFRQHGLPDMRMADLLGDTIALAQAREDAIALVEADPELQAPELAGLRETVGDPRGNEPWTL